MRIYTSRYQNRGVIRESGLVPVGITLGRPRFRLGYELVYLRALAPDASLFHINDRAEFEPKYREKLDSLGMERVREILGHISEENGGSDLALLCFEDVHKPNEWCHRQCFAQWWEDQTGEKVEELPPVMASGI